MAIDWFLFTCIASSLIIANGFWIILAVKDFLSKWGKTDFSMLPQADSQMLLLAFVNQYKKRKEATTHQPSSGTVLGFLASRGIYLHSEGDLLDWTTYDDGSIGIRIDGNITVTKIKLNWDAYVIQKIIEAHET